LVEDGDLRICPKCGTELQRVKKHWGRLHEEKRSWIVWYKGVASFPFVMFKRNPYGLAWAFSKSPQILTQAEARMVRSLMIRDGHNVGKIQIVRIIYAYDAIKD